MIDEFDAIAAIAIVAKITETAEIYQFAGILAIAHLP